MSKLKGEKMKKIIGLIAAIGLTTSMYANENTGCG